MAIKNNNISKKITFLLFIIFFLIGTITFKDYGISIDEEFQTNKKFLSAYMDSIDFLYIAHNAVLLFCCIFLKT